MADDERLRYDLLDDRWTLYAPERAARPHDVPPAFLGAPRPAFDPLCPFCPGNEEQLAAILFEHRGPGAEVPWATRVVPNRYPIVSGDGMPAGARAGLGGSHEIVIETPRHDRQLADMATAEIEAVLDTYRGRFLPASRSRPRPLDAHFAAARGGAGVASGPLLRRDRGLSSV